MGEEFRFFNWEGDCCASIIESVFADSKNSNIICTKKICIFLKYSIINIAN